MPDPHFSHSADQLRQLAQDVLDYAVKRGASAAETEVSEGTGQTVTALAHVDLEVHGRRLRVIAAHLGLGLNEREIQVRRLLGELDGVEEHRWPVSTGAYGYTTPSGSYTATSMNEIWYSKQWDNAPMPHSIFFTKKGHAIHGSKEVKKLGKPASHGCVRLSPKNAKTLFTLVKANGLENTQVVLAGETPGGEAVVASQPRYPREADAWPGPGYYYPPPPYGWGRKRRGYAVAPPPGWFRAPPRRRWFQGPGYYPGY